MTSEPARNEPIDAFLARAFGDNEARALQDTARAGAIAGRLALEPLPDGVAAPITLALPQGLAPIEYVIHVWTHKCSLCQTEHKHSEVFALNHLRSRTGAGSYVRNMSPVGRLEWNVPIRVHNLTTRTTAGCFECLDALRDEILPSLPKPPVPDAVLKSEGAAGAGAPDKPSKARATQRTSTDDFLL